MDAKVTYGIVALVALLFTVAVVVSLIDPSRRVDPGLYGLMGSVVTFLLTRKAIRKKDEPEE